MTVRTDTLDLRQVVSNPFFGTSTHGFYWVKTQSGTDWPSKKGTYLKHWIYDSSGNRYLHRDVLSPKPRRALVEDHPYTVTVSSWSKNLAAIYQSSIPRTLWGTPDQLFGSYLGTGNTTWLANDDIALIGRLRTAIAGSDFNVGIVLGEGHQTLRLIADAATRIYRGLNAAKRLDYSGALYALTGSHGRMPRGVRRTASNMWLELQYGWKPLVQDIHSGAEFLAQKLNFGYQQSYKVRLKKKGGLTTTSPLYFFADAGENVCYGQLIARVREVDVPALAGLTDPLSVAWELLPWSFVADWVIPVGAYLSARGLAQSLQASYVKTITSRFTVTQCHAVQTSSLSPVTVQPIWRQSDITSVRTVSSSLSIPLPGVKPLSSVLSWQHCANAVALLQGFKP